VSRTATITFTLKSGYETRFARMLHRFWTRETGQQPPEGMLAGILLGMAIAEIASKVGGDKERTLAEIAKASSAGFDQIFRGRKDS
jgi:hypothetical protein